LLDGVRRRLFVRLVASRRRVVGEHLEEHERHHEVDVSRRALAPHAHSMKGSQAFGQRICVAVANPGSSPLPRCPLRSSGDTMRYVRACGRRARLRSLAAVVFLACACGPAAWRGGPKPEPGAVAASIARGKVVYDQDCAPCHGTSGRGDGPLAAEYDPRPADLVSPGWHVSVKDIEVVVATPHYSTRLIKTRVETGNREMPAWKDILSAQQIDDVAAYVRSMAQ
jgi:mono/diheme cytochrome c family protein